MKQEDYLTFNTNTKKDWEGIFDIATPKECEKMFGKKVVCGKWYIEISEPNPCNYIFQSDWFDTEQEALDFANKITYLDADLEMFLLFSEWDIDNDTYTDIECVRQLR